MAAGLTLVSEEGLTGNSLDLPKLEGWMATAWRERETLEQMREMFLQAQEVSDLDADSSRIVQAIARACADGVRDGCRLVTRLWWRFLSGVAGGEAPCACSRLRQLVEDLFKDLFCVFGAMPAKEAYNAYPVFAQIRRMASLRVWLLHSFEVAELGMAIVQIVDGMEAQEKFCQYNRARGFSDGCGREDR